MMSSGHVLILLVDIPMLVEACATVAMAALAAVTLVVLYRYARDTKTIAKSAVEQLENSQMPFIAIVTDGDSIICRPQNQGFGPALNVQGWVSDKSFARQDILREAIPKGASGSQIPVAANLISKVRLEYESLSGKPYVTEIENTTLGLRSKFIHGRIKESKTP